MDSWVNFVTGDIQDQYPDGVLDLVDNVYSPEFNIKALAWHTPLERTFLENSPFFSDIDICECSKGDLFHN